MLRLESARRSQPLPPIEQCLLAAVAVGLVALLSLPAARGVSDTLGWVPLWLLAMPLSAWCALRLSRRPRRLVGQTVIEAMMAPTLRRRGPASAPARRRGPDNPRRRLPRAA